MACRCAWDPLCQWCRLVVHGCREPVVDYGAKRYHVVCWERLRKWAAQHGGLG
jgi:hypothetical protein